MAIEEIQVGYDLDAADFSRYTIIIGLKRKGES
jgi:hypothetical protein